MRKLFKHDSVTIVGVHITSWMVRLSAVQPIGAKEPKLLTEIWVSGEGGEDFAPSYVFEGDLSAQLEEAVT